MIVKQDASYSNYPVVCDIAGPDCVVYTDLRPEANKQDGGELTKIEEYSKVKLANYPQIVVRILEYFH